MHHAHADFNWTDDTIGRLRALWAEGHSTAEIGRRLGASKNAVVGKSHRLRLPARPSPIRRDGVRHAPRPRRLRGPTLPNLQALYNASHIGISQDQAPTRPPANPDPPAITAAVRAAPLGKQPCCWPIGEPGTASFRFCDRPNEAGKPYCPDHCAIAYPKMRDRRAAA
jgi:GcrA cell cycle regulator